VINNDYRGRLVGSGGRKNKACLDLEILAGSQFTPAELTTNIICRNCADKNETIVKKVNLVRNSLKTGQEAIAAQKESTTSTKRFSSDARVNMVKDRFSCRMPHKNKRRANKNLSTQSDLFYSSEEESSVEVSILSLI